MIVHVSDSTDDRLQPFRWRDRQLASSTDRKESVGAGLFVAEGDLVVNRALMAGCQPSALLCDDTMARHYVDLLPDVMIYVATESVRRDVTGLGVPLRAMGLFHRPALTSVSELLKRSQRVIVAEAIDNPTNLGAIIRSASALGWDGILLTSGSADPLARRALRVSMGTGLLVPFARLTDDASLLDELRRHGFSSVALTPSDSADDISTVTPTAAEKIAVFLGSERDGLLEETMVQADRKVRIPMHSGVDSLNVAAAAAIALYQLGPRA